jgi:cation diffusion facilitator family transporter
MNDTALAADQREAAIVRTSVVGIAANVALAAMKAAIGLASNSIAIVLDAVNNLSDALSSIITIAGTKLAHKQPDKKHPLGYGRIEYLTATIIAMIVLYAGITSLIESVEKIVSPRGRRLLCHNAHPCRCSCRREAHPRQVREEAGREA